MRFAYAVRYFHVVPVVPPLFSAAFAIAVGAAALQLMRDASAAGDALAPVLLLQLFVASSGFKFAARRGYYDLLLTSGTPRWQIALAHCLVSIAPGTVSWMCVAAMELVASGGRNVVSFSAVTCAAFVGASLMAWSVAVFSSRTATTVLWLLVMTIPVIARAVSPVRLLGAPWSSSSGVAVGSACAAAIIGFAVAVAYIVRGSTPLEAAQ
jgi:hypothetical protein